MKVAIGQIELISGDIQGNKAKAIAVIDAHDGKVDFVVLPEMTSTGYNCGQRFESDEFIEDAEASVREMAKHVTSTVTIVGSPRFGDPRAEKSGDLLIHNSAFVLHHGKIVGVYDKTLLANGGHHDDRHFFIPGKNLFFSEHNGVRYGILICEDIWHTDHDLNLVAELKKLSPDLDVIFCLNYSYFNEEKLDMRRTLLARAAADNNVSVVYCNACGVGDFVKTVFVYDGSSFVVNRRGETVAQLDSFKEDVRVVEYDTTEDSSAVVTAALPFPVWGKQMVDAITYFIQAGWRAWGLEYAEVMLSGGIDSCVVAYFAERALPGRVYYITMPSRNNGDRTKGHINHLGKELGIDVLWMPMEEMTQAAMRIVSHGLGIETNDVHAVAESTAQAVGRTVLALMATNHLWRKEGKKIAVLPTGNHTENEIGWFNFHDIGSSGAVQVIGDIVKDPDLFDLARFINESEVREIIPESLYNRTEKPAAELADADYDPYDYRLMSPVCEQLRRYRTSVSGFMRKWDSRTLDAAHGTFIYDYPREVVQDYVVRAFAMSKPAIIKLAQGAPILLLSRRGRGLSARETLFDRYDGRVNQL